MPRDVSHREPKMTIEKFKVDLGSARTELVAATADVMACVRAGKASGKQREVAVERAR
ncbi:hypothetical protein D3C84_1179490 [compost metagenome]